MIRYIALIIILVSLMCGACLGDNTPGNVMRTKRFIIYYADSQADTAARAAGIAEKWHRILSSKLRIDTPGITPIYLYPDRRVFFEATGIKPSDSIVGLAHTRTLSIRIDASGAFEDISRVIPHELVHVITSRKLRGNAANLPLWMHEGIAKYLADDWSGADVDLLAEIASSADFMPFRKLANVFPSDSLGRSKAYVQSYSAVKYMTDVYSPKSIPDLLDEIAKGEDFDTALRYSIGVTPDRFEADWRRYIMDKFRFGRWTNLWSGLVSAAMAIAALLAYRAFRIHKRRVIQEMESEESARHDDDESQDG